jgi:peptidoglycan/LPS O-acetylase OafA/YrhL
MSERRTAPTRHRFRPLADRVAYLDGLRGFAALMVFVGHAGAAGLLPLDAIGWVGFSIVSHGPYGVTVFFVLSAYTLCMSVAPAFDRRPVSWPAYFIRRFFRIAPLYYAVVLFAAYLGPARPDYVTTLFLHLSFLNMFVPQFANDILSIEWPVAVEWGFYLMFPVLVILARSRAGLAAIIVAAAALLAARNRLFDALPAMYSSNRGFSALFHLYAFVGGIAVYVAARELRVPMPSRRRLLWCLNVAGLAMVAFLVWRGNSGLSAPFVAIIAGIVILDAHAGGLARSVLAWTPLAFVGRISFSIYLLHVFFLGWVGHLDWHPQAALLAALAATLAAATLTYVCIERPGMMAGRLLTQRLTAEKLGLRAAPTTREARQIDDVRGSAG